MKPLFKFGVTVLLWRLVLVDQRDRGMMVQPVKNPKRKKGEKKICSVAFAH